MMVSPQRLARLGRRWYVRLTFALSFILLALRLVPSGSLLTLATVVLATVELLIYISGAIELVQLAATQQTWPRGFAWAGKVILVGGLAAILGVFLLLRLIASPMLRTSPLLAVATSATMAGVALVALVALVTVPMILGSVCALLVFMPFTVLRSWYRRHARRRYRYPTRIG